MSATDAEDLRDLDARVEYERVLDLAPGVRRITQRNPGLFSGPGTNTFVLGVEEVVVLEPGEERDDGHLERIVEAVDGRRVVAVLPSHGHPDHWPLTRPLAAALDAPILFAREHEHFEVDRVVGDGDLVEFDGTHLEALFTPGHAHDHLALHWADRDLLFPGDHVMGWSTTIIAPPEGDLDVYLASLQRLLELEGLDALLPAHGPSVSAPYERMTELLEHRHERTRAALRALAAGSARLGDLVARIYADIDAKLHKAAARSLWAHLLSLEANDAVAREPAATTDDTRYDFEHADRAVWSLSQPVSEADPLEEATTERPVD